MDFAISNSVRVILIISDPYFFLSAAEAAIVCDEILADKGKAS